MLPLIVIYLGSVLLKWAYEMLGQVEADRSLGFRGWWKVHSIGQIKKALIHVPLCTAWVTGAALTAVNAISSSVGLGQMETVNMANTVMAAWMLDSMGKPFAAKLNKVTTEGEP